MSNTTNVSATDISLGEFVTLMVLGLDAKNASMPFQNEEKWHRLFYEFKNARPDSGKPVFLASLRFDWDSQYPKCQDLSECLHTLHLNGFISVGNPSYDTLKLDDDVRRGVERVRPGISDENLKEFLESGIHKASQFFSAPARNAGI